MKGFLGLADHVPGCDAGGGDMIFLLIYLCRAEFPRLIVEKFTKRGYKPNKLINNLNGCYTTNTGPDEEVVVCLGVHVQG